MKKKVNKIINGVKTEVEIEVDEEGVEVVTPDSASDNGGDDKETNLAALRKSLKEKNEEIERLKNQGGSTEDFSLEIDSAEKPKNNEPSEAMKIIFQRDVKEASIIWNKKNKVTPEQWAKIRSNVSLTGDETLSQIQAKIDNAYNNLPEVRETREQQLREEGKKEAMKQTFDHEISLPVGGDSGAGGGSDNSGTVRIPKSTHDWGRGLGLSPKEIASIDPDKDTSEYEILDPAYKE